MDAHETIGNLDEKTRGLRVELKTYVVGEWERTTRPSLLRSAELRIRILDLTVRLT